MDIPGAQFLLDRYVRGAAARQPVRQLPIADMHTIRRVLVAVTTGMGDVILASPVIDSLVAALPQAEIALFCRAAWAPLFATDHRLKGGVIAYHGKYRRFFRTLSKFRDFSPDLVVAPHINDPDILPMLYLSGSPYIVRVPWGSTRHSELLSNRHSEEQRKGIAGIHVIDERLRVVEALGLPIASKIPSLEVADSEILRWSAKARAATACAAYAVLHVFSADAYRSIPADLARESLMALRRQFPELGWVLTGSTFDRAALLEIAAGSKDGIWVAAGELAIDDTAACVAGARVVIAPDTGNLHLAAALDRPLLALLSPSPEAPTRSQLVGPRTRGAPVRILEVPATCNPCIGRRCANVPITCLQAFNVCDIIEQTKLLLAESSIGS